jgi:hypothetical protein
VDNDAAQERLARRWGYTLVRGEVRLARGYDEVRAEVAVGGRPVLAASLIDPMPLRSDDVFYVANMNLAHTPNGLRLVQVDPEFEVERAERGRPALDRFDAEAWACPGVRPSDPIAASFSVANVTLPRLRYVCRPDVLAFEGSERVDA